MDVITPQHSTSKREIEVEPMTKPKPGPTGGTDSGSGPTSETCAHRFDEF